VEFSSKRISFPENCTVFGKTKMFSQKL
jgi:hypothetical protein